MAVLLALAMGSSLVGCGSSYRNSSSSSTSSSSTYAPVKDSDVTTSYPNLYSYSDGPLYVEYNEDRVISYQEATNYIGQQATVEGAVTSAYYVPSANGSPYFINFGDRQFCTVIWEEDQDKIDTYGLDLLVEWSMSGEPMDVYMRVSGIVSEYNGEPQIVVRSFDQIARYTQYGWMTYPTNQDYEDFGEKLNQLRAQRRN